MMQLWQVCLGCYMEALTDVVVVGIFTTNHFKNVLVTFALSVCF
jgi:hypothetical protein